mgnify:CR=1 FL=1
MCAARNAARTTEMSMSEHSPSAQLAVIGAGTMGHGIAQVAAASGLSVSLHDVSEHQLRQATEQIRQQLDTGVSKGKLTQNDADAAYARVHTTTALATAVAGADLVIEAIPEDGDAKAQLFAQVAEHVSENTILATNTSSLSVTGIAARAAHPERVIGMHFFNPPYAMKLLELVRAEQTVDWVLERARSLGEQMGRQLVVVNDSAGFATSRLGVVLGLEAMRMVEQGVARAEDIDRAMQSGYKHPVGPLQLSDMVGLDVRLAIAEYLHTELGGEQFRPPQILRRMVRAGKLGKKSGRGFYAW